MNQRPKAYVIPTVLHVVENRMDLVFLLQLKHAVCKIGLSVTSLTN